MFSLEGWQAKLTEVRLKRVDDCVPTVLCSECCLSPPFPSSSSVSVRDLGQAIAVLSDRHNSLLCIFSFFFFLLEASHTVVLNVFIECFNHFHGG